MKKRKINKNSLHRLIALPLPRNTPLHLQEISQRTHTKYSNVLSSHERNTYVCQQKNVYAHFIGSSGSLTLLKPNFVAPRSRLNGSCTMGGFH